MISIELQVTPSVHIAPGGCCWDNSSSLCARTSRSHLKAAFGMVETGVANVCCSHLIIDFAPFKSGTDHARFSSDRLGTQCCMHQITRRHFFGVLRVVGRLV